ncbi:hypothetical protein LCGC14_0203920 [marine sediment metagenome]|uniref:Small basic protein n=1 Tax=marine sediment metagenome TaxID=412755 RepID=A0A0F9UMH6_9ZZZZ|nr:small basic protein [Phycisphaerae bacterium]HDZ43465.1 small basic protein [Phycisphaerae bacterium]
MSIDRTLKFHGALKGSRSVLTRAERITLLIEEGKFDPEADNPFGLPKVRIRHSKVGTKSKKEAAPDAEAEAEAAEGTEAPAAEATEATENKKK